MTDKEKLYLEAKEAYYNGEGIMSDLEFDSLEKELGFENNSTVGSRHNPSYTVKHPVIMGSLSKVQIHENKNGDVEWGKYLTDIKKYTTSDSLVITPKYDGCSFEVHMNNGHWEASTRGDGEWGKDIKRIVEMLDNFNELVSLSDYDEYIVRGEILVDKNIYEKKYSEEFTNPRSFVSGVINHEFDENDEIYINKVKDLDYVVYDYKVKIDNEWVDKEFIEMENVSHMPSFFEVTSIEDDKKLEDIYNRFNDFRRDCRFALDGFVIKPVTKYRNYVPDDIRPKDCVAIKFIPMIQETEVVDITWQLGKTSELTPIIWVKPVEMDGRMVQKCSGHNIGVLKEKKVSIGCKIIMSLAGDIIPFLYKVTDNYKYDESKLNVPNDSYEDGVHLMKALDDKSKARLSFISSAKALQIPDIGPETASKIFGHMTNVDDATADFFGDISTELVHNILECKKEDIYFGTGGGRQGTKASNSFVKYIKSITLGDIIKSCNFRFCGDKVAKKCEKYILDNEEDFDHMPLEGYEWCMSKNSLNYIYLMKILDKLSMSLDSFRKTYDVTKEENDNKIPVILTGEPVNYSSKNEFLRCNPQYRMTGSWKEVKIVFTNSLDSNTGKMKKAREKGIKIELY